MSNSCTGYSSLVVLVNLGHLIMVVVEKPAFQVLSMCKWVELPTHIFWPSQEVLGRWEVPMYNDTYVMLFFGLLKKLVSKWLTSDANEVSETVTPSMLQRYSAWVQSYITVL